MTDTINSWNLKLAHVNGSSCSGIAPLAPLLMRFFVCGNIEGNEEDQVGAKDTTARDGSEFFTGAFTGIGHPLKVC